MKVSDNEIKKICSSTIYKRGLEYFKDGRVHIKLREEQILTATVDGEELYNVRIDFNGDEIKDYFCTCPYYQTMGSSCKHIVATLKKRQTELLEGENFKDENDKIAQLLCNKFANECFEKKKLNFKYSLNISTENERECKFYVSIACGFDELKEIDGIDRFFDCFINMSDFKISKHTAINSSKYSLSEVDSEIINILCEAYQNKVNSGVYTNRVSQTMIAPATAERLLPLFTVSECDFYLNSVLLSEFRVIEDNPDILIDINATDSEITLNIFESGISLFKNGSWFIYENCFYHTEPEWRSWFMPIYNSLLSESRTQIDFKGSSRIDFATYVYPKLRNKQGVVTTGLDTILINEKPEFSVFLDYKKDTMTAAIKAHYGTLTIQLPKDAPDSEKIVIRDLNAENDIISYFNSFNIEDNLYFSDNGSQIYDFIFAKADELSKKATIYASDSFNKLFEEKDIDLRAKINYNDNIDLLELDFETELSDEEILGILNAVKLNEKHYRTKDGTFLKLGEKNTEQFKLLDVLSFSEKDIKKRTKQISKYHLLYIEALKNEGKVTTNDAFNGLVESIKNIKIKIPNGLNDILRQYQKDGVLWLKQLSELGFGGILADDMGLGKTLEVIAFVMSEKKDKPSLVVAPSALTYNWLSEIKKFAPDAKAKIADGTKEERANSLSDIDGYDFIITSYPLLRRDPELFSNLEFSYMFIDESQHIKNPDTMSAKAVKKIKADRKFALSGTPIENRLSELWSVFDFVMKGYLYSYKEFSAIFEKNIQNTNSDSALIELRKKIGPFVLRRMKADVLAELPEKIENTIYSDFVPEQKKVYEAFHAVAKKEIDTLINEDNGSIQILTLLLRLRQICCHPGLFDRNYNKDSGKLLLLEELIESATSQGHRILIFSQFTSMLNIIRERLSEIGKDSFFIDGKTPAYLRNELAQRFNDGEKEIFLISLKAGGTGLNLTGADTVILYDPWWNPAVMEQAADRAYRIGQTKAVQVIKLATKGSIEEQILKLQESKKNLADNVIRKNAKTISGLTKEEILSLFE